MTKTNCAEPAIARLAPGARFTYPPPDLDVDLPVLAMAERVTVPGAPNDAITEIRATSRAEMSRRPEVRAVADESDESDVDLSLWESPLGVRAYVHARHQELVNLRHRWDRSTLVERVLWWVPVGHTPDHAEGEARLRHLRECGPDREAFTLRSPVPPPQASRRASTAAARSSG